MAIWQFDFWIIPRSKEFGTLLDRGKPFSGLDLGCQDFPQFSKPENLINEIKSIAPEVVSWSSGLRIFGNEESDCIKVFFEGDKPVEFFIRIDVREIDYKILKKISTLALKFDCVIADGHHRIYSPSVKNLLVALENSEAFKFVKDPNRFFTELTAEDDARQD